MRIRVCFVGLLALGCPITEPNPGHCSNNDGDSFCAEAHGVANPFCAVGSCAPEAEDGCVAARPTMNACYSPCGQGQTAADSLECDGVAETGGSASTTTTSSSTTTTGSTSEDPTTDPETTTGVTCVPEDCTEPDAPFCGPDGVCIGCTDYNDPDDACAGLDLATPVCFGGACVACSASNAGSCGGATPVCDQMTNTCVGCTYHSQCALACDIDDGECLDGKEPIEVDADGACSPSASPFCEIQQAVASVAGGVAVIIIHEAASQYTDDIVVVNGKTIAMLAAEGDRPRVTSSGGVEPTLSIRGGATTVYVQNLRLQTNAGAPAIEISSGTLVVDETEVVQNDGGALLATMGANVTLRNSILGSTTSPADTVDMQGADLVAVYTTFVGGLAVALRCDNDATAAVRNAFVFARSDSPEVACNVGDFTTSVAESGAITGSQNSILTEPYEDAWFDGPFTGDYHLAAVPADVLDQGRWRTGDPAIDLDGDARPTEDDVSDAVGADLP